MFKNFYCFYGNAKTKFVMGFGLFLILFLFLSISYFFVFGFVIAANSLENENESVTDTEFLQIPEYSFLSKMVKEENGEKYLDCFFPIADEYIYNYVDTFGATRTYGGTRKHLGIDIMADEGISIIAVESGTVEQIGWNYLGGWRMGIRSEDGERYWYYAHMRKTHPYVKKIIKGSKIQSGQVIGYVGSTGYDTSVAGNSMPENNKAVDGNFETHLHIGLEIIGEGYINPYPILNYLEVNKMKVKKSGEEYIQLGKSKKERLIENN